MKKAVLIFCLITSLITISSQANAQFEYIGGGFVLSEGGDYAINDISYLNNSIGIDLRAVYVFNKKVSLVPDIKIYLPNKEILPTGESKTTAYALNINFHYNLNSRSRDNYRIYLLAGGHFSAWNIKDKHIQQDGAVDIDTFKFVPGGNAGIGINFKIANRLKIFAEVKYAISKTNQLIFTPGLLYDI